MSFLKSSHTNTHTKIRNENNSYGRCSLMKALEEKTKEISPVKQECSDFKWANTRGCYDICIVPNSTVFLHRDCPSPDVESCHWPC